MGDRKVILVTGASRGIGRALAVAAGSSGYDTAIHYRSSETEATKTVEIIQAAADDPIKAAFTLVGPRLGPPE